MNKQNQLARIVYVGFQPHQNNNLAANNIAPYSRNYAIYWGKMDIESKKEC